MQYTISQRVPFSLSRFQHYYVQRSKKGKTFISKLKGKNPMIALFFSRTFCMSSVTTNHFFFTY